MTWLRWIRLQLVSETRYMLIDGARGDAEAVPPDLLHEGVAGDDVAARLDEKGEEIEFHRAQLDGLSGAKNRPRSQIDEHIGKTELRWTRACFAWQ